MFRMNLRDFNKNWVLEDYRFRYNFTINSILWELDTVRVNCIKTHGEFNCTLPSNDCAFVIYGIVQAKERCTRSSYSRENGVPTNGNLLSNFTKWGDFTTMKMQLKMHYEGRIPYFSVQCPVPGFNDSVTIVALVYRCTRAVDVLDI
ncbi:hypothetical protein DPMN_112907 [Dreissena polymorpha]|nr:hypothetical protein DPMN_112907 [Dreissena polymorpha]